ncbi:MAG TPA: ABC transporter permease [Moheibacter sp.]|nr:ABC transporter permease [Moheibacter sp.]
MLRLLKIEWNKIYYYKTARIFTILYFVMLIILGGSLAVIKPDVGGVKLNLAKLGMFEYPVIWQNLTYLFAIAKVFLAVIIITNVTNEYSNGTLKQNLIDGFSKSEMLKSKILTILVFAIFSSVFVFLIIFVLGQFVFSNENSFVNGIEYIGMYFLKLLTFFSICLFFSFFLRKSAFALLGVVVWWMIEKGLGVVEFFWKAMRQDWDFEKVNPKGFWLTEYLPLNASANLITLPKFNPLNFQNGKPVFELVNVDWTFIIAALVYTALFLFFSYRLLKKRDL